MPEEEKIKLAGPENPSNQTEQKLDVKNETDLEKKESKNSLIEKALEELPEDKPERKDQADKGETTAGEIPGSGSGVSGAYSADEKKRQIENILADGLEEVYVNLPENKQKLFKKTGEETSDKINTLLQQAKVNIKKIANLIKKWLMIIPGVNLSFLEQEAKIKTDKIVKLK